jgi:anti-anti-sigma regulatory factor
MTIKFENDIKTDFDGYQKLVDLITNINNSTDQNIIFDFANVFFFEANLCAILATIIEIFENKGRTVKLINFNSRVETILRKNEFLIQHGYGKIFDRYETSIRYQKFDPSNKLDDNNFEDYIKQQLLSKNDFPSHSKLLGKHITLRIFELYENARTHGSCDYIHACGQYFPKQPEKPLNVTIVDTGKNFQENVSKFLNQNIAAEDAIDWAMKKGHTTKTGDISGGLGLDLIFQFIQHNKGKIQIISSDGFWEWHRGKSTKMKLNNPFNGTIANLRFNLNDTSHYKLTEETDDDWNNLF